MKKENIKKVVLAYSGGLDTSIIIPWLKENYNNCEVVAVSGDVGQGTELDGLEEKAIKTGASKLYVLDLKKDYVENYIWPCLKADAKYEDYLLGTSHARPCIAAALADIAKKEHADAICHGCTGKGNDQVIERSADMCLPYRFYGNFAFLGGYFRVFGHIYLLFSGFLLVCNSLTFTLARTGVVLGVLPAQRKTVTMADTPVATDIHKTLDVHLYFGTEFTFYLEVVGDLLADQGKFVIVPFADFLVFADTCLCEDFLSSALADAVDVGQSDDPSLVFRQVYPCYSCHKIILCFLLIIPAVV